MWYALFSVPQYHSPLLETKSGKDKEDLVWSLFDLFPSLTDSFPINGIKENAHTEEKICHVENMCPQCCLTQCGPDTFTKVCVWLLLRSFVKFVWDVTGVLSHFP